MLLDKFLKKQQPNFSKLSQFLSKVPFIMLGVIFDQESYKVDLISESVGTILWCEISSAIPSDGPIFSEFYQMKFGNFVEV